MPEQCGDKLILALDPSSTRTGWAVSRGPEELVDAGLLLPQRQRDDSETRIDEIDAFRQERNVTDERLAATQP